MVWCNFLISEEKDLLFVRIGQVGTQVEKRLDPDLSIVTSDRYSDNFYGDLTEF